MGREIRRVPVGWEHPRDESGSYRPLLDRTYEEALAHWEAERDAFPKTDGAREFAAEGGRFEEWYGSTPNPGYYRPAWDDAAQLGWCLYEDVSEGTPLSPVFSEPEGLHQWLVEVGGYEPDAAARFMVNGSAPSFVIDGRGLRDGIAAS